MLPECWPSSDTASRNGREGFVGAAEITLIENVEFVITDLDRIRALAMTTTVDRIFLDDDGSGVGWNPLLDSAVGDRYDLLTVVAHELGHLLDQPDTSPLTSPGDLMNSILQIGDRNDNHNGSDDFFANAIDLLLPF